MTRGRTHSLSSPGQDLTDREWEEIERILERFEDAWRRDGETAIESYLTGATAFRHTLLIELVHVDLDYRIRRGHAAHFEQYLDAYPELRSDPVVQELRRTQLEAESSRRETTMAQRD